MHLSYKYYTTGKSVYFPLSIATFLRKMHLWIEYLGYPHEKPAKSSLPMLLPDWHLITIKC